MSIQNKNGRLAVAMIVACLAFIAFGNDAHAQPDTQGSENKNTPPPGTDPFQGLEDEDFQLPGVPELPSQDPAQPGPAAGGGGPTAFQTRQRANQPVPVNDKYAGWQQVSDGEDGNRLSDIIRSHWVMADEQGTLTGVVYGIEGADVGNLKITLLNRGREVTSTRPKEDGSFSFPNVRQGTYGIVGWGDNAFFAFGLNILRYNEAADDNVQQELKITATPNETTINTDWIQFYAGDVKFPIFAAFEIGEDESDPAHLYGLTGQSLFLPESRPATSTSSHLVTPTSDGRVIGRVHQLTSYNGRPVDLRNTRILLLKDDDVYAAVTSDAYGAFEFPALPAGEYSCVAVGQDGMGCIGIYLGEADSGEEDFAPLSFTMIPSETTGWLHKLARETAYQRVISRPIVNYDQQQMVCSGCGQSGCNGHCGGGQNKLRPGGYRPPPRSSIPRDQRFLKRANRFVDDLFFRDAPIPPTGNQGGINNGGYYQGGIGAGNFAPANSMPTQVIAPGPVGGSASRIPIPAPVKR